MSPKGHKFGGGGWRVNVKGASWEGVWVGEGLLDKNKAGVVGWESMQKRRNMVGSSYLFTFFVVRLTGLLFLPSFLWFLELAVGCSIFMVGSYPVWISQQYLRIPMLFPRASDLPIYTILEVMRSPTLWDHMVINAPASGKPEAHRIHLNIDFKFNLHYYFQKS